MVSGLSGYTNLAIEANRTKHAGLHVSAGDTKCVFRTLYIHVSSILRLSHLKPTKLPFERMHKSVQTFMNLKSRLPRVPGAIGKTFLEGLETDPTLPIGDDRLQQTGLMVNT